MKKVVIGIKRANSTVNVTVTFDDDPFELLDESNKPKNEEEEQKQLISLAQSIVANKIIGHEINLDSDIKNHELRTHVLISEKKEGGLQVSYTNPYGISVLGKPLSLGKLLQDRLGTVQLTNAYGEIGAEQTLRLPQIPENILQSLQAKKAIATIAKGKRDLDKQKEEFLTKGPSEFPEPAVFPLSIKTTAVKDIDLKNAVEKLSALHGNESQLNPILKQIETVEEEIKTLEIELTELKKKEASLKDAMSEGTVASFAQTHLQTSKSELEETRKLLENKLSTLRADLSRAKSSFENHVKNNYALYEKFENGQEFTKQVMLTALYNAALDNYKELLKDTKGQPETRKKMVEIFNKHFGGIAIVDDYGKVNPIEETYKSFADTTLSEVVALANEVIKVTEPKFIETRLIEAKVHCQNQYPKHFNNLIYNDQTQTTPFIMEKSFSIFGSGTLQKININTKFDTDRDKPIQSASDPRQLRAEESKIPDKKAIEDSQSQLKKAQTQLTELEQKVRNFQRYTALIAELEAKEELAPKQKIQLDKVTESFNNARDSIITQIKDQPVDVQKYVLQNINPQLAKSVVNELPEANKKFLITVLPELTKIPEKSEIELFAEKYAVLANEIATARKNLNQIKEKDIQVEQLNQLRSALDKVNESQLDASNLEKVLEQSHTYTQNDLAVDGLIFQQQLTTAKKRLAEQIKDVEEKFESIKQANKEWLTIFESERQLLIDVESSFKEMEYQRDQSEKNKEELQRLTELATRSYMNILSEYEQINERIKLAQGAQTVEQAVILETRLAEEPKEEIVTPPTDNVSKDQNETPPTPNKGAMSGSKPETIVDRIKAIYEQYFKAVREETENLSQKEPSQWQELFKEKNAEGNLEEFKAEYLKEIASDIKKEKAVAALNEIIKLIQETEWKTGFLGSKSKINIEGKKTPVPVPNHIYEIYLKAQEGIKEPKNADLAMQAINAIATRAKSHSAKFQFLRKRDEQTQEAYDAIETHSKPR
ncbi:hypothetical protein Lche_0886 [Legionella cherrii]|uniref:Uncharacterized protein n=1 Tax=Legionella cherrii TaxID=28084 RepID=A0A0W0S652_9GAMM|nr:hypothetical protein [Legionella cherrii]KTC78866.1 hypothetical protein Lche_0886 [Legionella cherrii]